MAKEKNYFVFFKDIVTAAKNGIMLAADKRKLDGIEEKANNYTHPKSGVANGSYTKVTVDANGHVTSGSNPTTLAGYGITDAAKKDHTHETIGGHKVEADVPANAKFTDTTYSNATQSASGLLSAADKQKLDGIDNNAKNITVDTTLSKTSANPVQNKAIATELENLKKSAGDGKNSVVAAVTQMGVPTATDADFATIAANIKKISTGVDTTDATATAGAILAGQTAYVNEKKIIGTMSNQGTKTAALNCGGSYIIPAGYHNGAGIIAANSLASQTGATAVAGDILSGKTAYVNGAKIIGNITSKAAQIYTPGTANQEIAAGQYLAGVQTIKGDANLKAENIKKGVSIFGVTGNAGGGSTGYAVKNIEYVTLRIGYGAGSFANGEQYNCDFYNGDYRNIEQPHMILIGKEDYRNIPGSDIIKKTLSMFDLYHKFFCTFERFAIRYGVTTGTVIYRGFIPDDQIANKEYAGIFYNIPAVGYSVSGCSNIVRLFNGTVYAFPTKDFQRITSQEYGEISPTNMYAMLIELDV